MLNIKLLKQTTKIKKQKFIHRNLVGILLKEVIVIIVFLS